MAQSLPSEMVGATTESLTLAAQPGTMHIDISEPTGPARFAAATASERRHVYLHLKNITSEGVPSSYAIYLNLPEGSAPEHNRPLFAGLLPAFGVAEASRKDEHNPGSGLSHSLDVTNIVDWLQAHHQWDPNHLRVTFVPRGKTPGEVPVKVGQASLHYKVPRRPEMLTPAPVPA